MDSADFDAMARSWDHVSRRAGLRWLTGGVLSVALTRLGRTDTEGKKKKNKKKPKKKKTPNDPYVNCGDGFYVCVGRYENGVGVNTCCPVELGKCCPYGCCQDGNPYLICGPDANTPCLLDI